MRQDGDALATAFDQAPAPLADSTGGTVGTQIPEEKRKTIFLGCCEGAIVLALIEEYLKAGRRPIPSKTRNEIIANHAKTSGATMMMRLRAKGAIVSDQAKSEKCLDCIPVTEGVVYIGTRNGKRLWPPFVGGDVSVEGIGQLSRKIRHAPSGPEPVQVQVMKEDGTTVEIWVLAPDTTPVVLSESAFRVLGALYAMGGGSLTSTQIISVINARGGDQRNPYSIMYTLEQQGCLRVVSGRRMSRKDPAMRAVVFRPFRARAGDNACVSPPECDLYPSVQPAVGASGDTATTPASVPVLDPVPVVEAPAVVAPSRRVRSREELEREAAELERRFDEIMSAAIAKKRFEVDTEVDELERRVLETQRQLGRLEDDLGQRREELKAHSNPAVDLRSLVEVPKDATDLLAQAGHIREALAHYDELVKFIEVVGK
jgi:hypothetical protein